MKSIWRFSLSKVLLLAIAAMGMAAIPAHAQTASGTFSLAHKVLWAGAALPAGDYVGSSSLVLQHEGGESVVSTLRLKNIGMALEFATPKLATPVTETAGLGPIADSQPAK